MFDSIDALQPVIYDGQMRQVKTTIRHRFWTTTTTTSVNTTTTTLKPTTFTRDDVHDGPALQSAHLPNNWLLL
jgi:hypothetical protein